VVNLFERLAKKRPLAEAASQQPHRRADSKALLMDVLANGPVPATLVEERGAAHGLSKKQLRHTREQMKIVAFKEVGKLNGRWFWALPRHAPEL
jgi:hypothetical protein